MRQRVIDMSNSWGRLVSIVVLSDFRLQARFPTDRLKWGLHLSNKKAIRASHTRRFKGNLASPL